MYLDVTYFGYGVGLVMAAWFMGMVVGTVFRALRSMWYFAFILIPFFVVPSSSLAETFNCYTLSTAFISHVNKKPDMLIINGVQTIPEGTIFETFECKGDIDIDSLGGNYSVSLIPIDYNSPVQVTEYPMLVSLFIGAVAGIAFVIAVDTLGGSRGAA